MKHQSNQLCHAIEIHHLLRDFDPLLPHVRLRRLDDSSARALPDDEEDGVVAGHVAVALHVSGAVAVHRAGVFPAPHRGGCTLTFCRSPRQQAGYSYRASFTASTTGP